MKGADVAMATIVQYNDWLDEEVSVGRGADPNMGLKFRILNFKLYF